jgi:hypothetical protein
MNRRVNAPANPIQPVDGEVIPLARYQPFVGILGIIVGIMVTLTGLGLALDSLFMDEDLWPSFAFPLGSVGVLMIWAGWYNLTRKPRLVLGYDRMQRLHGKRVVWELPYENIGEIKLFTDRFDIIPIRRLGIILLAPEIFDLARPRRARTRKWNRKWRGVDFHIPAFLTPEPPERLLDVVLTCYHRFKTNEAEKPRP